MTDTGTITRTPGTETAVLAGGCFWGMEDLIRRQPGVLSTRVGYTGGSNDHATYRNHPGHAEAVEIVFDPTSLPWRSLVDGSWIWKKNSRRSRYEITEGSKSISTASAWPGWLR